VTSLILKAEFYLRLSQLPNWFTSHIIGRVRLYDGDKIIYSNLEFTIHFLFK
jgi:hypothetical protein